MPSAPALQSLSGGVADFLGWWRDELGNLVPERARLLFAPRQADTILAQVDDGFVILKGTAGQARPVRGAAVPLSLPEVMPRLGAKAIGLRLPLSRCFVRQVELPAAARSDLRQILDLDLERATPFKLKDVYTTHLVEGEGATKGRLRVRQIIIRREAVDPLIAELEGADIKVDFVDCWNDEPSAGLAVNLIEPRPGLEQGRRALVTPVRALSVLALLLLVSAVMLTLWRYDSALAQLQDQTAKARAQAASVRQVLERSDAAVADLKQLQDLRLRRVPALEILEEVTRIMPDTSWLNDLRVEGDTLDLSGLAKSGASLPPLFERSPILADGALSAPLTFDQREDKERFSLRVRVKNQTVSRETAAGEKQN
jgi:general secretion pathway protein L